LQINLLVLLPQEVLTFQRSSVPGESYIKGWHLLPGTLVFSLTTSHPHSPTHVGSLLLSRSAQTLIRSLRSLFLPFTHSIRSFLCVHLRFTLFCSLRSLLLFPFTHSVTLRTFILVRSFHSLYSVHSVHSSVHLRFTHLSIHDLTVIHSSREFHSLHFNSCVPHSDNSHTPCTQTISTPFRPQRGPVAHAPYLELSSQEY
jgi:hypothetical protein